MAIIYTSAFFIIGTILGSFYNVVGLRIPQKLSIITPPSHCPTCKQRLLAYDLIPVFSYICLRGRCRGCKTNISPLYMLMELICGLLFSVAYIQIGWTTELIVALLLVSLLMIVNVSDLAYMLIPNKILVFFLPLFIMSRLLSPLEPWWDSGVGAVIGFCLLWLIAFVSKGGIGGGDIKLFLLLGLVLGVVKTLFTLFLASVIGLVLGVLYLGIQRKGRKTPIPFAPAISLAALISYFCGEQMIQLYMSIWR